MNRGHAGHPGFDLKQKHQPVRVALKAVLTDDARELQVARLNFQRDLFVRFSAGAGVRRFALIGVKFSARRTPQAAIRFLRAFEQ